MHTRGETLRLQFRKPKLEDGAMMWELVHDNNQLELNSAYSYLMLTKFFTDTCVIVEDDGSLIGFISSFRLPTNNSSLFVWQIAVSEHYRGKGIGTELIHFLLEQVGRDSVNYLEATISPSNEASRALFAKASKELETTCEVSVGFQKHHFPDLDHEVELLYRLGPLFKKN